MYLTFCRWIQLKCRVPHPTSCNAIIAILLMSVVTNDLHIFLRLSPTILFYRDASSALSPFVNQRFDFTGSRSPAFSAPQTNTRYNRDHLVKIQTPKIRTINSEIVRLSTTRSYPTRATLGVCLYYARGYGTRLCVPRRSE